MKLIQSLFKVISPFEEYQNEIKWTLPEMDYLVVIWIAKLDFSDIRATPDFCNEHHFVSFVDNSFGGALIVSKRGKKFCTRDSLCHRSDLFFRRCRSRPFRDADSILVSSSNLFHSILSKQNMKETLIQLSLVQMISRPFGISVASIPINEILFF